MLMSSTVTAVRSRSPLWNTWECVRAPGPWGGEWGGSSQPWGEAGRHLATSIWPRRALVTPGDVPHTLGATLRSLVGDQGSSGQQSLWRVACRDRLPTRLHSSFALKPTLGENIEWWRSDKKGRGKVFLPSIKSNEQKLLPALIPPYSAPANQCFGGDVSHQPIRGRAQKMLENRRTLNLSVTFTLKTL